MADLQEKRDASPADPLGGAVVEALDRARERQRELYEAIGYRPRLGKILALSGVLKVTELESLVGTSLLPPASFSRTALEAEMLGEIALRTGKITSQDLVDCLRQQAEDRCAARPHRLIGALLVERGVLTAKAASALAGQVPKEVELARSLVRRRQDARQGARVIDLSYVRAARDGTLDADTLLLAVEDLKRVGPLLSEPTSLWELLLIRGLVAPGDHVQAVEQARDSRAAKPAMLGTILVELGFIQPAELAAGLKAHSRWSGPHAPRFLGEVLIEQEVITPAELAEALRVQSHRRFGEPVRRRRRQRRRLAVSSVVFLALLAGGIGWRLGPWLERRTTLWAVASARVGGQRRAAALARLARSMDDAAARALRRVLRDSGTPISLRVHALLALGSTTRLRRGDVVHALESDQASLQAAGAWMSVHLSDPARRGLEPLLRAAGDARNEAVALAVVRARTARPDAETIDLLVRGVDARAPATRRLAAYLDRSPSDVAGAVASVLQRISGFSIGADPEHWAIWRSLWPAVQQVQVDYGPDAERQLRVLLRADDLRVRYRVARLLALQGDRRGLSLLVRGLDPNDVEMRPALLKDGRSDAKRVRETIALLHLLTGQSLGEQPAAWVDWWRRQRGGTP